MQLTLKIVEGPSPGKTLQFNQSPILIGRDPEADAVIQSPLVSRRHAQIVVTADKIFLEDLGSSNGTFVDDRPVTTQVPIFPGNQIRLGPSIVLLVDTRPEAGGQQATGTAAPDRQNQTVLDSTFEPPSATVIPQLTVVVAGSPPKTYPLEHEQITLGRADDNDIVIPSLIISRHHAVLNRENGGYTIQGLPEITNPIYDEGRPLLGAIHLRHNQKLRVGGADPGLMVTLLYESQPDSQADRAVRKVILKDQDLVSLGRDPGNDVVLDAPNVSRFHAQIERVGQRYRVRDLRSSNGTYVNDERVEGETWLVPDDTIRIGSFRFVLDQDQLAQYDESGGFRVEAVGLQKWVRKDLNILQNISTVFQPREFIVLVGQSGGGKSTLMDALAGYRPATNGSVRVNGVDVYKNFDAIRNHIGYVPQRDIIHMELTVFEALDFAARLRMPADTTRAERHRRIHEVLEDLDLLHRKDVVIRGLSGGQQKRVSIGVELLTKPGLFFLDEPTSGLDPGTETAFMHLMRRLADQGRTIVLVTHATKNVMLADKVIFLARGGYLAWFGPPDEALAYFDQYRSSQERRTSRMEFDKIYAILDNPEMGTAEEWAQRYQAHPAYEKYILSQLKDDQRAQATGLMRPPVIEAVKARRTTRVSGVHQFLVLSARGLKIILRDRSSLILMVAAAPLIGSLDFFLAMAMGRDMYSYTTGDPANISTTLFLLTIYSLMVGGLSQMREFVKEREIYRRERLVNLKILPYVMSKVWFAALLALYQALAYTVIRYLAFDMPGGSLEFGMLYVTLVLTTLAGMMLGLLVSAFAPNPNSAPLLMIMMIIPQIVLSGALAPVPSTASAPATTRWAFQAFLGITGVGSDIAADPCWALPENLRESMTLDDKAENNCRCMGRSLFDQDRCDVPGVGGRYDPAVDTAAPVEPPPLGDPPPSPEIPPPPPQPGLGADTLALTQYLEALRVYQEETEGIRTNYEAEISAHQARAEAYAVSVEAYQEALIEWQTARNSAIGEAEGLIEAIRDEFGWTFINKENGVVFWSRIGTTWIAQGVIILVLFGLILFFIKRKD